MATEIAWADEVWNPSVGCTRVSEGCDNCYAFALHDRRYAANLQAVNKSGVATPKPGGVDLHFPPRLRMATARELGVTLPFPKQYDLPFSQVQLLPDRLDKPLHWRKPRRVFVDSMSDLFHEEVPDEFIARVFAVMGAAKQHTFQVLTKRPERMRTMLEGGGELHATVAELGVEYAGAYGTNWPLPNVWLGVSVENQAMADLRIPPLLETPAAVRWISAEPLLEPVDFYEWMKLGIPGKRLDWMIVGGESGPRYRKMDHAWARAIRDQCKAAGIAVFLKQDSGKQPGIALPPDLSDREFPA